MAGKPKPVARGPETRPFSEKERQAKEPNPHPYALAGLKRTAEGYVVVVAKFDGGDELQELTEFGPPEALKQYATTRLIRRIKNL